MDWWRFKCWRWRPTLPITPTETGNLLLKIQGKSAVATAEFFLDGITFPPFNSFSRHYGYEFDFNPYVTVNPFITQTTEATVAAYTGISINHGTNTITITSDHSIEEIYDYCYYNLCQTANLAEAEFFTTADGVNYVSTYNLVLNGGDITGSGTLSLGAATLTRTTTETTTVPISYGSGTGYFTNLTVSGLIAGSVVYVYDTTGSVELYRAVVAGTSVAVPILWTGSDHTLEIKVTNNPGTGTAYLPWLGASAITDETPSVTVLQEADVVYNDNAIDGSTVTEFSTDFPNIQIDFSTGVDTTLQRLYAWLMWRMDATDGILYYFGAMEAADAVNYIIDQAAVDLLLDNTSGVNIRLTGGYLSRKDGSSYIYGLTANSIIPVYDRAYIANSDDILADLKVIKGEVM